MVAAPALSSLAAPFAPPPHPLLDAAEPITDARALVIGPASLEALCGLIGRGCAGATELSLSGRMPAERAEIVLVPQVDSLNEASQIIALARRALLPCGRIVMHDHDGALSPAIARLLRASGFSAVRSRADARGTIITADWPMFGLGSATNRGNHHA